MSNPPEKTLSIHDEIYRWAEDLFPICRSLTGDGTRTTLRYLKNLLPQMKIFEVPTGTPAFDWEVPEEWNIRDAWIKDSTGKKIVDFQDHNLHVMGYSEPVDELIDLDTLQEHLYSLEEKPDAIPYVTSYYKRRWGFCMRHGERQKLQPGDYHVHIDSDLGPGSMTYGELILPGSSEEEIFLSTDICHPSMGNNELSGPLVTTALARWLSKLNRHFTYRIIFIPETIGSIFYLSRHLQEMQARVQAGFVLTCVGDDNTYSYVPSRLGDTLADRVATHVLEHHTDSYDRYIFRDRGSDERQYCSVNVDLPVALIMRSKFHVYPEYHTSLDDLCFISREGLGGAFEAYRKCLQILEKNKTYKTTVCCEPQLGKRGLYPSISPRGGPKKGAVRIIKDLLANADGTLDLIGLADKIQVDALDCIPLIERLVEEGLLAEVGVE